MSLAGLLGGSIAAPVVGGVLQYLGSRRADRTMQDAQNRLQDALAKIQNPNFDMRQFTPEEYKLVGTYAPQMLQLVNERAPELAKLSAAGEEGRKAQLGALQKLVQVGREGATPESQALVEQAMRENQIQNQGQQRSIIDSFARRGGGGSGAELAEALSSQQGSDQASARSGTEAALAAYQSRLQALRDSGSLGGQIQQNDYNMQANNADIINRFNQRMAENSQRVNMYNNQNLNDASRANLAAEQNVADQNVNLRNSAVSDKNQLAQQQYQNALDRIRLQNGVTQETNQNTANSQRDQNSAIQGASTGISTALLYADEMNRRRNNGGYDNGGSGYGY